MSETPEILCFHCGQSVGDPPVLNELPDGETCPVCRDRALEAVAPALPSMRPAVAEEGAGMAVGQEGEVPSGEPS